MASILSHMSIPVGKKKKKTIEQIVQSTKDSFMIILNSTQSQAEVDADVDANVSIAADDHSSNSLTTMKSEVSNKKLSAIFSNAVSTLSKRLTYMKVLLYGDVNDYISTSTTSSIGSDVDETKIYKLSQIIQDEDIFLDFLLNFAVVPFESRKDIALIFNNLIRKDIAEFVDYVYIHRVKIIVSLVNGYHNNDISLSCGSMIREVIRYEKLHACILYSFDYIDKYVNNDMKCLPGSEKGVVVNIGTDPDTDHHQLSLNEANDTSNTSTQPLIWDFFNTFVHLPNFDVSSDAFNTLRELLLVTKHKKLVSNFLDSFYDLMFEKYELLLKSQNYVIRRRSLNLLSEVLLDRSNFSVMMKYISVKENLMTIMNLLRDKSPNIQLEAFHVFKVFVANPHKPVDITSILQKNKVKLINFISNFQNDRDDIHFMDEKALLIETLTTLEESS